MKNPLFVFLFLAAVIGIFFEAGIFSHDSSHNLKKSGLAPWLICSMQFFRLPCEPTLFSLLRQINRLEANPVTFYRNKE